MLIKLAEVKIFNGKGDHEIAVKKLSEFNSPSFSEDEWPEYLQLCKKLKVDPKPFEILNIPEED